MRAGVGFSNAVDATTSARDATITAVRAGRIERPTLVLAFAGGSVDAQAFFRGVQAVVGGGVPILGGSAVGVITNEVISYEGHPAGVAVLELDDVGPRIAAVGDLASDELEAGERLGRQLAGTDGTVLLTFYDSVKAPATASTPPVMNAAPLLLRGLEQGYPRCPAVVGAGVLGDYAFSPTWQFCGTFAAQQHAVAAVFGPSTAYSVQVMHGCTPMDGVYHTITRIDGNRIDEIDGRPAADLIDEIYGSAEWREQRPVRRLAIGVHDGGKHATLHEEAFVNRLITGVIADSGAIDLFEPDLHAGTGFLFMLRDGAVMVESARNNAQRAVERMIRAGITPRFGLYIDCAGRAAAFSDTLTEEAAEVQSVLNEHGVALLGMYSGVEVAPMLGRSRGLDWTGVLMMLGTPHAEV